MPCGIALGQTLAGRAAWLPPWYLAELEAGTKKNPSLDVLRRLAKALPVDGAARVSAVDREQLKRDCADALEAHLRDQRVDRLAELR